MDFYAALRFLTALPLPDRELESGQLGRATAWFPLVGLLIGAVLALADVAFIALLPVGVASALTLGLLILLTGGLHLDGLMDTCDGLFGRSERERRLEIMRDSRVGGFGVLAGTMFLLLQWNALAGLVAPLRLPALLLMVVAARACMVVAIHAFPYARPQGIGKAFKEATGAIQAAVALLSAVVLAALSLQLAGLGLFALTLLVTAAAGSFMRRRLGGLTGDCYGAINEVSQLTVLLGLLALHGKGYV